MSTDVPGPSDNFSDPIQDHLLQKYFDDFNAETQWLSSGKKLKTEYWLSKGYDTLATQGAANWTFVKEPKPSYHHKNYPSIQPYLDQVSDHWNELLALGKIEYFNSSGRTELTDFVKVINPIHVVIKPDGTVRPLVDPTKTKVNECMAPLPLTLVSIEKVAQRISPGCFFAKRDLKHGFHHVVLGENARKYMGFRHPITQQIGRWVVLPFGASLSPYIFRELTDAAREIFQREFDRRGIQAFVVSYVDDFLIWANTHAELKRAFNVTSEEGINLGLTWKEEKDIGYDSPTQKIEFLGLLLDSVSLHIYLPKVKREAYLADLLTFKTKYKTATHAPLKEVQRITGRLCFTARACRWGHVFLQHIFDSMYSTDPAQRSGDIVTLNPSFWSDFNFWYELLGDPTSPWHGKHAIVTSHASFIIENQVASLYTDASSWGAGAVWHQGLVSTEFQYQFSPEISALHSGKRELIAAVEALRRWGPDLNHRFILLYSDNIEVISAINRGTSRVPFTRDIIKQIAYLSLEFGFQIRARHVPGPENTYADALSRRLIQAVDQDYTFAYFRKFCGKGNYEPTIDCCCSNSGFNMQPGCERFFSERNSVLGNIHNMVGHVLWANPPFAIAGEVVEAIYQAWLLDPSNTRATILLPEWKTAPWYRKFVSKKRPLLRVVFRYPSNSVVFRTRGPEGPFAGPCPFPILIFRLP